MLLRINYTYYCVFEFYRLIQIFNLCLTIKSLVTSLRLTKEQRTGHTKLSKASVFSLLPRYTGVVVDARIYSAF